MSQYSIENQQLRFTFDTDGGLMCTSIYHKTGEKEWLRSECPPFVLKIQGTSHPANEFLVKKSQLVSDSRDQCLIFELQSREWDLRVRLSVMRKEENLVFLLQAGALWEEGPEEVYLHIPLFRKFIENGNWSLSANPRGKPDGTPAIETHEEFPLPICHIEETGKGIMMELPDDPEFTGTWNQNRNRQLLQMTDTEDFLNHELLLRLQNRELADVLELDFSALTKGYKEALVNNWQVTKDIVSNSTEWGGDVFDDVIVADQLMTGVGAVGGAIGGGAYYVYEFFADMIRKGGDVNLRKGEVLNVILVDPVDVPVI